MQGQGPPHLSTAALGASGSALFSTIFVAEGLAVDVAEAVFCDGVALDVEVALFLAEEVASSVDVLAVEDDLSQAKALQAKRREQSQSDCFMKGHPRVQCDYRRHSTRCIAGRLVET
jgi:hypothetical protein